MVDRNQLFINPALVRAFERVQPSMPIPPSQFENLECEYCDNVNKDWRMEEIIDKIGPQAWGDLTQDEVDVVTKTLNKNDPIWGSGMIIATGGHNARGYQETNQYPYFVKQCQFGIFMMGVLGGQDALETITENDKNEYNYYPLKPLKLEKQIDKALTKEGIDVSNLKILRRQERASRIDWRQMTGDKTQRPWNMLYKYRKLGSLEDIWPDEVQLYEFWKDVIVVDSEGHRRGFRENLGGRRLPMFYRSMDIVFPKWIFTVLPEARLINFPYPIPQLGGT
jgi:hypothetical protein